VRLNLRVGYRSERSQLGDDVGREARSPSADPRELKDRAFRPQCGVLSFAGPVTPLFLIALLATAGANAATPSAPPPSTSLTTSISDDAKSEYRVGAGDGLDIVVLDNAELSRIAVVQTSGNLSLPILGEVRVAGLTVSEIKTKLTTLLKVYLVDPHVEVKVKEYQSQFVTVIGEVNNPGRKPLREHTRLLDVLLDAGGFSARASGDITVSRQDGSFPGGEKTLQIRLGRTKLSPQDQTNLEALLRSGDLISASPKYFVTVEGEVTRPGRYAVEPDLTVSGAVSLAGGLTRYGSNKLRIRRTDPTDGTTAILKADLRRIRNGAEPDVRVQANDVITVDRSLF
jgi:polysaccharide export outer membrane protein